MLRTTTGLLVAALVAAVPVAGAQDATADRRPTVAAMHLSNGALAAKLNGGLKLPAMPVRGAEGKRAPTPPPQVVMLHSRAIAEESGGRTDEAVKLYKAALDSFPDYAAAKKALTRLESGGSGQ